MLVWLIFDLAFGSDPPSHAELVRKLDAAAAANKPPQWRAGVFSYRRPVGNLTRALCTEVNKQDQICTWPIGGNDFGFTADPNSPYTTWDLAITEQIRRLRYLNGT